jgi:hypothetical protein
MKRYFLAAMTGALSVMSFAGCANQSSTATTEANPSKKTYTHDDLDRSGQATTGQALKHIDPDVSGGR